MKYIPAVILTFVLIFPSAKSEAQTGSFKIIEIEGKDSEYMYAGSVLISQNWISFAFYSPDSFMGTMGGTLDRSNGLFTVTYEYHSKDKEQVGKKENVVFENLVGKQFSLEVGGRVFVIERKPARKNEISGVYRISGRERNGEMREMTWGSRKTLKFLIGGMFQWVAFDSETGSFSGTGGGAAESQNGEYVEMIEFFSRDQTRVGAELSFNYELDGDEWIHSGLSSKGAPIKEIWKRIDEE